MTTTERCEDTLDAQPTPIVQYDGATLFAEFSPPEWTREVTLKEEAKSVIGQHAMWESLWPLNCDDSASSPFANDWAMKAVNITTPFVYCRLSDLINREIVY